MYNNVLTLGDVRISICTDVKDCLNIFMSNQFVQEGIFGLKSENTRRTINIYMYKKKAVVEKVKKAQEQISFSCFTVYISNKIDDPKGIIIERSRDNALRDYIIIADNTNSEIIFLRSVLIKLFFEQHTQIGCYPLHCSGICHKGNGYLFLADSKGGKSTVFFAFSAYAASTQYKLLTDDTVLCKWEKNKVIGYCLSLIHI